MDLDQLQSVRDRERQTDRLQQLRESFYEEAADFVAELRAERQAAAAEAEDPFDAPRVNRLSDRIRTAEQTLEAIYEKRVGKVVKAATFAAADLPAEADGMTKEEADLFDTLVDEIEANRSRVLDRLKGEGSAGTGQGPAPPAEGDDGSHEGVDAADLMGGADAVGEDEPEESNQTADPGDTSEGGVPPDVEESDAPVPPEPPEPPDDGDDEVEDRDAAPGEDSGETDDAESSPDGDAGAPAEESADEAADVERELVRITDDVGPILGVDEREYDLAADDVVTLPAENAQPLVERGAAERLE